jgi:Cu-Zn family superoxide dismutase
MAGIRRFGRVRTAATVGAVLLSLVGWVGGARAAAGAQAKLRDAAGAVVGVVNLSQKDGTVLVRAVVNSLPAGFHGFHVHATGECTPPFTSAGGHFNPTSGTHGDHAGDMPSLLVNADGAGQLQFATDRFSVADLFDADGSAIIVHAARDNFANIPTRYHSHTEDVFGPDSATLATGDAGARSACGVVT